ncbi:hydrogenase [Desulfobacula sp.]|uniref:hydrogenase n=1 Tax=Desulfobacula sp. TaxID=2593537 RepID=UPI002616BD70|nr:hydrogenase [Desulfobacula sp.]
MATCTCKDCKFVTPSPTGDPSTGVCLVERMKLADSQQTKTAIRGKMVQKSMEACLKFEAGESWKDIKNLL